MKSLLLSVALAALCLVACKDDEPEDDPRDDEVEITPETFPDLYAEKWCAELTECAPDQTCNPDALDFSQDCPLNLEFAKECLDRDWICEDINDDGIVQEIQLPIVCIDAYNCDTGDTGGDTGAT